MDANDRYAGWSAFTQILRRPLNLLALGVFWAATIVGIVTVVNAPSWAPAWLTLVGAPTAYTFWIGVPMLRGTDGLDAPVTVRILLTSLVVTAIIPLGVALVHPVALASSAYRSAVSGANRNPDSFFYGVDGVVAQSFIVPLLVYLAGAVAVLAFLMLVGLPWLALRHPDAAASGTNVEHATGGRGRLAVRLVFVGLGPLLAGITLWAFSGGGSLSHFGHTVRWVAGAVRHGYAPSWGDASFVLGVLLVAVSGTAVAVGCALAVLPDQTDDADPSEPPSS